MTAANPRIAVDQYAQLHQAALHCVTAAKLQRGTSDIETVGVLTFLGVQFVELRRRQDDGQRLEPITLGVDVHYQVFAEHHDPRQYRVVTVGYRYAISTAQQREIIAFHWHPGRRSHEQGPHLHVGSAIVNPDALDFGRSISRYHIPTGHMTLARIVRMMITEFQVVPNRQDWETVVDQLLGSDAVR